MFQWESEHIDGTGACQWVLHRVMPVPQHAPRSRGRPRALWRDARRGSSGAGGPWIAGSLRSAPVLAQWSRSAMTPGLGYDRSSAADCATSWGTPSPSQVDIGAVDGDPVGLALGVLGG